MSELLEIRNRLEQLEKANRRWRSAAVAAMGMAAIALLVSGVQKVDAQQVVQPGRKPDIRVSKPIAETVAARTIVLCDGLDNPRLLLTADGMALFDPRKRQRVTLTENGIVFQDDTNVPRTALTPDRLAIYHNGGAEFTRVDADGFIILDGKGEVRACMKADDRGSFVHLGDRRNRILFGSDAVLAALRFANIRLADLESEPRLVFVSVKVR